MATGQYRKPEPLPEVLPKLKYSYKTFSPRQWGLLKILRKRHIDDAEAFVIDQRPFNSFVRREFILKTKDGYCLSDKGYQALDEYEHADVRKDHASDLGKYVAMLKTIRVTQMARRSA